ncbi:MAG: TonB-dependent receptor [Myxococcota bacterium]
MLAPLLIIVVAAASEPSDESVEALDIDIESLEDIESLDLDALVGTVTSASKTALSVDEAPSIVNVVTAEQIERSGYRTLAEVLRYISGLYLIDDHLYANLGVRGVFSATGSANDIVKVMLNGQPIAFRSTQVSFLEHDLIPIRAVERVEVILGPASALYGANAFMGVINVITKGAEQEGDESWVSATGAYLQNRERGLPAGTLSAGTAGGDESFRYLLTGTYHRSNRSRLEVAGLDDIILESQNRVDSERFPPPEGSPTPGWDGDARAYILSRSISLRDREETASVYGLASVQLAERLRLEVDGHLQSFDRYAEWQDFSFLTRDTRITHLNGFARLRLQLLGDDEGLGWAGMLSVAVAAGAPTDDERIVDRFLPDQVRRRDIGYTAIDLVAEGRYVWSPSDLVILGVDVSLDSQNLQTMEVQDPATGAFNPEAGFGERDFNNVGVYAQGLFSPVEDLVLTVGARGDYNSQIACDGEEWDCFGTRDDDVVLGSGPTDPDVLIDGQGLVQLSARAAATYQFSTLGAYGKLLYGSSFKPPSPFQLFHRPQTLQGSTVGNPALLPQNADTFEAKFGMRPTPTQHFAVTAFHTRVSDVVVFLREENTLVPRNADAESTGIELEASVAALDRLNVFAKGSVLLDTALSPQRLRDETEFEFESSPINTEVESTRYPDWSVVGGVNLALPEQHLNVDLVLRYASERRASLVNNQLFTRDLDSTYSLPGYLTGAVTVSTTGLYLFDDSRETRIAFSVRDFPGRFVEPGSGGIDIPSLSPAVLFSLEQRL